MVSKDLKRRNSVEVVCQFCNKAFLSRKDQLAKYCSRKCSAKARENKVEFKCSTCSKIYFKPKSKLKNSKSGFYFCSRACKELAQKNRSIPEILPPHYGKGSGKFSYRKKFDSNYLICKRCGYNEFSSCVDIHHIDQNRENNKVENLIPLCACCHKALHLGVWSL